MNSARWSRFDGLTKYVRWISSFPFDVKNVSVIKLGTYRVAAKSAKTRVMSTTSSKPKPARCSEVRFAEVDFPGVIQSRLVIEYTDGLKIIVGSHDDLHLAADLISELRRRQRKGARK